MAAKAVTKSAVDWTKLSSRVNPQEIAKINRFKSQIDSTGIRVASLPADLPTIDWSFYKAHASNPKQVEELEKNYKACQVKRPTAPSKRLGDLQTAYEQDQDRFKKFCVFANSFIESATVVRRKFENMIPVEEMNLEEWTLTFPHWSFTKDTPSVYPHYGRMPGLTREEAAACDQPDPLPYSTKQAWIDWDTKYKKWYE